MNLNPDKHLLVELFKYFVICFIFLFPPNFSLLCLNPERKLIIDYIYIPCLLRFLDYILDQIKRFVPTPGSRLSEQRKQDAEANYTNKDSPCKWIREKIPTVPNHDPLIYKHLHQANLKTKAC